MRRMIETLDDTTVKGILARVAASLEQKEAVTEWSPEMGQALRDAFGAPSQTTPVSEGELARQALALLAEDPAYRELIRALIEGPAPERFGLEITAIAMVPVVLLVLQTHVRFKRDKAGKWEILIEKKPTQTALLKSLIEKLLSWISGAQ